MTGLLHRGFVAATGRRRLPDVVRYLKGMAVRLEKLPANAARDALWQAQVEAVWAEYLEVRGRVPRVGGPDDPVVRIRWMVEELRVSLFAQSVGTPARSASSASTRPSTPWADAPHPCPAARAVWARRLRGPGRGPSIDEGLHR